MPMQASSWRALGWIAGARLPRGVARGEAAFGASARRAPAAQGGAGRAFWGGGGAGEKEGGEKEKRKGLFNELQTVFSKEKQEERSRLLKEEVTKGQFHELNELKATGGKLFEASTGLIPAHEAVTFPNVDGFTLDNRPCSTHQLLGGKVTLVTISLREFSRPMMNSWTTPFHSKLGSHPYTQIMPLSFIEGFVYKWIKGPILSGMQKKFPPEQSEAAVVAFGSSEDFRKVFDMKNRLVAYSLLVDQQRRVRWRGVGYALGHESKSLVECANKLLEVRS